MKVAVHTDSSFSERLNIGGWACWIESQKMLVKTSGTFKNAVDNSTSGELMAIANALRVLQRHVPLADCEIEINTDSRGSITMLKKGDTPKDYIKPIVAYVMSLLKQCGSYEFVHVPAHRFREGHPKYGENKFSINQWCDYHAWLRMRGAAERKKLEPRKYNKGNRSATRKRRRAPQTDSDKQRQAFTGRFLAKSRTPAYKRARKNIL